MSAGDTAVGTSAASATLGLAAHVPMIQAADVEVWAAAEAGLHVDQVRCIAAVVVAVALAMVAAEVAVFV